MPRTRKPGPAVKKTQGGLARRKWMNPDTLLAFRKWMHQRGTDRAKGGDVRLACRAWTDYLIVEILSRMGLRAGELVATDENPGRYLRIEDLTLDSKEPQLFVREAKCHKARLLDLPSSLRDLIRWYLGGYRGDAKPQDPLIENERTAGKPATYHSLVVKCRGEQDHGKPIVSGWAQQFGLQKLAPTILTPHVFRHSYAVDWITKNGPDYRALAEILGHSDPTITMKTYCHIADGKHREYAERM